MSRVVCFLLVSASVYANLAERKALLTRAQLRALDRLVSGLVSSGEGGAYRSASGVASHKDINLAWIREEAGTGQAVDRAFYEANRDRLVALVMSELTGDLDRDLLLEIKIALSVRLEELGLLSEAQIRAANRLMRPTPASGSSARVRESEVGRALMERYSSYATSTFGRRRAASAALNLQPYADREVSLILLRHPSDRLRRLAVDRLREETGYDEVRRALIERLRRDPDAGVRERAVAALQRRRASREQLQMHEENLRVHGIALPPIYEGGAGDSEVKQALLERLRRDSDTDVRAAAALALQGEVNDPVVKQALLERLRQDASEYVRHETLRALQGAVSDPEVRQAFLEGVWDRSSLVESRVAILLEDEMSDPVVRQAFIDRLIRDGGWERATYLKRAASRPEVVQILDSMASEPSAARRIELAESLREYGFSFEAAEVAAVGAQSVVSSDAERTSSGDESGVCVPGTRRVSLKGLVSNLYQRLGGGRGARADGGSSPAAQSTSGATPPPRVRVDDSEVPAAPESVPVEIEEVPGRGGARQSEAD